MRTYGRLPADKYGNRPWAMIETDAAGHDDYVWLTTLVQALRLSPNESPFYAGYGIPAHRTIVSQVFPDFYVTRTQGQFAQFFASLLVFKLDTAKPTYSINVVTNAGARHLIAGIAT